MQKVTCTAGVIALILPLYFSAEGSNTALKVGSYILIAVGSFSMLLGFLGCLGAIYEIRCLLGLVRNIHIQTVTYTKP